MYLQLKLKVLTVVYISVIQIVLAMSFFSQNCIGTSSVCHEISLQARPGLLPLFTTNFHFFFLNDPDLNFDLTVTDCNSNRRSRARITSVGQNTMKMYFRYRYRYFVK
jgi:hypothetical protein